MEIRHIDVIDATDLANAVNERYKTHWQRWHIAHYGFYDKSEYFIRYYYFGNENDDDDKIDDQEWKIIETLRRLFPDREDIYIDLGR